MTSRPTGEFWQGLVFRTGGWRRRTLHPLQFAFFNLPLQLQPFYLARSGAGERLLLNLVAHQSFVFWELVRPARDLVSKNFAGVCDLLLL